MLKYASLASPLHVGCLFVLVLVPAQPADPALGTVCSNGLSGVEADEICCALSCGLCGGVGCGSVPGLTGDQCCITTIEASGELCSITGAAPCRVDPPSEWVVFLVSHVLPVSNLFIFQLFVRHKMTRNKLFTTFCGLQDVTLCLQRQFLTIHTS